MNFNVIVLPQALDDISRNASWWAENHSLEQARKWATAIRGQLETLRTMPERFAIAPENAKCSAEVREQPLGIGPRKMYRAVFTIRDESVFVLAVRAGEQASIETDEVEVEDVLNTIDKPGE